MPPSRGPTFAMSATSESSPARNSSGIGIGQNSSPARSALTLTASRTASSPITPAVRWPSATTA